MNKKTLALRSHKMVVLVEDKIQRFSIDPSVISLQAFNQQPSGKGLKQLTNQSKAGLGGMR